MYSTSDVARRLRESLEAIEWAVSEIPEAYHHALPDFYAPEEWHAGMNLAHLVNYEDLLANPVMAALADGGDGTGVARPASENWFYSASVDDSKEPLKVLMGRFREGRARHIELVQSFGEERLNTPVCPLWSVTGRHGGALQPPGWVAMKTFQHSWEHGNALLRLALFAPC